MESKATAGVTAAGMTLRVYRISLSTGARTDLRAVDPTPGGPLISQVWPPCECRRCRTRAGGPVQ
ncbi:hypothetical protein GCM10027091_13590 [Streptomyces daliensis]